MLADAVLCLLFEHWTSSAKRIRSLAMRRVLRRIALGKGANYYLKGACGAPERMDLC